MIHFVLLISRQGKIRLTKWYSPYSQKERSKVIRELSGVILTRGPKLFNFVDWRGFKVVYRRYASLYFCMCIDQVDNGLEILEIIHHYVEILDRYFGSVCKLDLIFNFHKLEKSDGFPGNAFWVEVTKQALKKELKMALHESGSVFLCSFSSAVIIEGLLLIVGELQESSKKTVARLIAAQGFIGRDGKGASQFNK